MTKRKKRLIGWVTIAILVLTSEAGMFVIGGWRPAVFVPCLFIGIAALYAIVCLLSWAFDLPDGD